MTMLGLKDRVHRSRLIAELVNRVHWRSHERHFERHLADSVGEAVQWRCREYVRADLRSSLDLLLRAEPAPSRKGSPSRQAIINPSLQALKRAVESGPEISGADLRVAARIASIDPANLRAFRLYLAAFWLHNEPAIDRLRETLPEKLIVHISCLPRQSRAQESTESFAGFDRKDTGQVILVGHASENSFDADGSLLHITADDSYEGLPRKTFEGLGLLALACNPACVLKLDDDHRLKDRAMLGRLLDFASSTQGALQMGEVNRVQLPSAHHRAWHFGKCTSPELNDRILTLPAPRRWAAGSAGYILNRGALWRLLWASLYYDRWLGEILYEDLAVAEVAIKTGIRVINAPMRAAIAAVAEY